MTIQLDGKALEALLCAMGPDGKLQLIQGVMEIFAQKYVKGIMKSEVTETIQAVVKEEVKAIKPELQEMVRSAVCGYLNGGVQVPVTSGAKQIVLTKEAQDAIRQSVQVRLAAAIVEEARQITDAALSDGARKRVQAEIGELARKLGVALGKEFTDNVLKTVRQQHEVTLEALKNASMVAQLKGRIEDASDQLRKIEFD